MITFFRTTLALLLLSLASAASLAKAQLTLPDNLASQLDTLLRQEISWQGETPAYTVLVDHGGTTIYTQSLGLANIEHRVAPTKDTVYQVGSISKSYTALAILQLVEQRKVKLDNSVNDYLEDYQGPGADATIRQLLTHTSGIPNYTAIPEGRKILAWVPNQREDILALFQDLPLDFAGGSNFSYSNSGYYLLGLIVEAVTGQDYYDHLAANVYEPLGLTRTYSGNYEEMVPNRAQGYQITPEGFLNAPPTPNLTPFAAGSIVASAEDIAKYRRNVFTSKAVSKKLLKLITTTDEFADGTAQSYALGALIRGTLGDYEKWGHSGGISGFVSHHDYYPGADLTVVVLTNTGNPPASPPLIAREVAAVVLGVSLEEARHELVTVDEAALNRYAGHYQMSPFRLMGDGTCSLFVKDGGLQARFGATENDEEPGMPLQAISATEFLISGLSGYTLGIVEKNGQVTGFELHTPNGVWPAVRD